MKFAIVALLGAASATKLARNCYQTSEVEAPVDCGCAGFLQSAGDANRAGLGNLAIGGGAGAGATQAILGAQDRAGAYAKLTSESAGSQTQIGAQNIVIPDKHTVTDQAKVSEAQSNGKAQSQKCQVAERTFEIAGSITVNESYNDKSKSEHCASKDGEGASQTRSRTQVQNNCCAQADIPCTCSGPKKTCGCCY